MLRLKREQSGSLDLIALDGVLGWLLSLGSENATYYPVGFSDAAFRRVKTGMNEAEVIRVCGPPFGRYRVQGAPSRVAWNYSGYKVKGDYHIRGIIFENGQVIERVSEFWVD